ncbi:30S ribosomal protein S1 [bacterium]|nr:30S ribosomal protein S1 [bacterium]
MADVEKTKNQEMTGEPVGFEKGGDAKEPETQSGSKPLSPQMMEDGEEYSAEEYQHFVDLYSRTLKDIEEGQIVSGRVLAISKSDVVVDIGFKSEGTVPIEEFPDLQSIKIGDKIEVFLDNLEDSDGQLQLSKRKADFIRLWDRVVDIHNQGGTIEGRCVRRIKGGIVVDLMGVDAFLPGSQIDVKPIRDFDALIGQMHTFKIVKVNKLRKNIVVSRRVLLEESMAEMRKTILGELEKGQVRKGTVKNITDFGVFVDLGGVDGLLHINDLSWGRVGHPSEVVKLDQELEVMVLDFNDAKDRISLGMKQLQPHPWMNVENKFPEGSVVKGKVVSIADYGAFVELERGVEGLVHVSEMSWTRNIVHPSKILNVGDEIEVKILNIDKDRKRISLGIKQLTPDPWSDIAQKYPVGSRQKGRIRNMTNFGAFVELEDGIDGLIHISDISWTRKIKHPSELLTKNQDIEVQVLEVNPAERRLSLGVKQLSDDPWPGFEKAYSVGTVTQAKVIRLIEKGIIVELPLGLEGFVPLSQLEESTMAKVAQNIKEGDELSFAVIEFDRDNKRIVLSRKKAIEAEKQSVDSAEHAEVEAYMQSSGESPTLGEMAGDGVQQEPAQEKKTAARSKKPAAKKEDIQEAAEASPDQPKHSEEGKEKKSAKKAAKKKDEGESQEDQTTG